MDRAGFRASDADRERAVELLRGHAAVGRLTVEELDERCAAALEARTFGELDALTADLPPIAPPPAAVPPPAPPSPRYELPGRVPFAQTWRAPSDPERVIHDLLRFVAPALNGHGYELRERTPDRLVFERSRRPAWTIVLAVLFFPLGLVALLHKDVARVAIHLSPAREGTLVAASGTAPLAVRRAFRQLEG
jgi:Domain of unknown function (DUF1707)